MNDMKLYFFILLFLFNSSLVIGQASLRKQPNIITVLIDDLGYETAILGDSIKYIEGGPQALELPTLRTRLMGEGFELSNAYATASCSPSRVQFMSGQYLYQSYHQFGYLNWNSRTIAQELLWNGYNTCVAGKWQLHGNNSFTSVSAYDKNYKITSLDNPRRLGYNKFLLHSIQGNANRFSNCANYIDQDSVLHCSPGDYGPQVVFDYFLDYIDEYKNSNRPFFFDYRMNLSHEPFEPIPGHPDYPNDTINNALYLPAMLTYMDSMINNIVDVVDTTLELQQGAGTVLMILSDNGSSRGWITNNPGGVQMLQWGIYTKINGVGEYNGNKSLSTYLGCHIPAFIYVAGPHRKYEVGSSYDAPFGLIDVYPTIMDLAGLSHLKNGPGVSIADEIVNYADSIPDRIALYQHYNPFFPGAENNRGGTNVNSFVTDGNYWLDSYDRFYDIVDSLDWELLSPVTPTSAAQLDAHAILDSIIKLHPKAQDFNKPLIQTLP